MTAIVVVLVLMNLRGSTKLVNIITKVDTNSTSNENEDIRSNVTLQIEIGKEPSLPDYLRTSNQKESNFYIPPLSSESNATEEGGTLFHHHHVKNSTSFSSNKRISSGSVSYETKMKAQHNQTHYKVPKVALSDIDRTILYLHVGKTGGMSLDRTLKANCDDKGSIKNRDSCYAALPETKYQSVLSNLTIGKVHARWYRRDLQEKATSYLYSIRNPISRIVSAFNMCHVDNHRGSRNNASLKIFYKKCFPTIEDLATVLHKNQTMEVTMDGSNTTYDCLDVGKKALQGIKSNYSYPCHFLENYAFYTGPSSRRYPDKEILIVRTEFLWDDILLLEQALRSIAAGGHNVSSSPHNDGDDITFVLGKTFEKAIDEKYSHGSEGYVTSLGLSAEGKKTICCYLSNENQIFEDLVRKAVNLDDMEKTEYLNVLYRNCGIKRDAKYDTGTERKSFDWSFWRAKSKLCE